MSICVNSDFDSGNITVIDIAKSDNLRFAIRNDTNSDFKQWFYFKLSNVVNQQLTITIEINGVAYPEGFNDYNIFYSYDRKEFSRVVTKNIDGEKILLSLYCEYNSIYFAYFEPYTYERHLDFIASLYNCCEHLVIGQSNEQRDIDLLVLGNRSSDKKIWITARQHPGESMGQWFVEGLVKKLLNLSSSISRKLLQEYVFFIVPNMNPDGVVHGNLRTNSLGYNLNREWNKSTMLTSPEVYCVREYMQLYGLDMYFDIHGDESIPYVFLAQCDFMPNCSSMQKEKNQIFKHELLKSTADFQVKYGYTDSFYDEEKMLSMSVNWVANTFKDSISYVLEMPFKDNNDLVESNYGWNGARSYSFGEDFLHAIYSTHLQLL